ncbi:MAG: hypothetical protein ACJASB_003749 [Shewanella psychromarinicola]|jgi:hypothetical protein
MIAWVAKYDVAANLLLVDIMLSYSCHIVVRFVRGVYPNTG